MMEIFNWIIHIPPFRKYLIGVFLLFAYWICKKQYIKIPYVFSFVGLAQIVCIFTKAIFRIPNPNYTHTYSFPSGHVFLMLAIILITLWLFLKNKKKVLIIANILALYEGWKIIFLGYHTIYDVIVAYLMVFSLFFAYKKIIVPKIGLKNVLFFNFYAPYVMIVWLYKLCPAYMTTSARDLFIPTLISLTNYVILCILEKRKNFKVDNNID